MTELRIKILIDNSYKKYLWINQKWVFFLQGASDLSGFEAQDTQHHKQHINMKLTLI